MMMGKIALAAGLSILAGSALAADGKVVPSYMYSPLPMVTGDLEVGFGAFTANSSSVGMFTTTGRASAPIQGPLNFEMQATANALVDNGDSESWGDAYGHAWWRNPSSAWGVFGGAEFAGDIIGAVGGEFKHYVGNMSFGGDVAYLWTGANDGWEISGTGNLYLTPNHRVGLFAQYVSGFGAPNAWNVKVDAEARFAGGPWSVWGSLGYLSVDGSNGWNALAGFRMFMDSQPKATLAMHETEVPFRFHSIFPFSPTPP
jgi:hypothetical protein